MEQQHLLRVLKQTKEAVKKEDIVKLKELSNKTIHSASIYQDINSVTIAVIIYSLSKMIERTNYKKYPDWHKFFNNFLKHISNAISALKENNEKKFREELLSIRKDVSSLSGNFKKHIQDVFRKASINKASRIYEHGISMEQTSKLLGITLWELAQYAGQKGISDINLAVTLDVKKRIKLAEELFK